MTVHDLYLNRINKVLDFIDKNKEQALTLEELASVANFSKYHFSRIFQSVTGLTPYQFVLIKRLEKAATILSSNKYSSITCICEMCGFHELSVFTRYFRQHYRVTPTQFRNKLRNFGQTDSNIGQSEKNETAYFCSESQIIKWTKAMEQNKNIHITELPEITVAYIRNIGPYDGNMKLYREHREKLFAWAGARDLFSTPQFKYLIVYHDNPVVALSTSLRMSLCIGVPDDTQTAGEIGKMKVEGGKYAIFRFEMKGEDFQLAWEWIYGQWFPKSGYLPDDKPYFETYPEPPAGETFVVDFCIPVVPCEN